MSYCQHNIIANSSFSWWGAWLNTHPKKIVIAPKQWFNNQSITVIPCYVLLKIDHTEIKIPMNRFKAFAEWYLEDQGEKDQCASENTCDKEKYAFCDKWCSDYTPAT